MEGGGEREREIKEERKKETYRDILNDIVVCGAFFSAKMLKSSWLYAVFARSFSIPLRLKKWFSIDFGETNSLMIEYFFVRHFPPKIEIIDGSYKCHIKCFRIGWRKNLQEPLYLMRSTSFVLNFLLTHPLIFSGSCVSFCGVPSRWACSPSNGIFQCPAVPPLDATGQRFLNVFFSSLSIRDKA